MYTKSLAISNGLVGGLGIGKKQVWEYNGIENWGRSMHIELSKCSQG